MPFLITHLISCRIFYGKQLRAVLHQLLQWETAAVFQWPYSETGSFFCRWQARFIFCFYSGARTVRKGGLGREENSLHRQSGLHRSDWDESKWHFRYFGWRKQAAPFEHSTFHICCSSAAQGSLPTGGMAKRKSHLHYVLMIFYSYHVIQSWNPTETFVKMKDFW